MTTPQQVADIPGLSAPNLVEAFRATVAANPGRVAARTPDDSTAYTYAQLQEAAERLAAGFHGLGLRRGDTLGIMLVNRPEFHVIDIAALCVGATPFSIYNTSAPEQIEYLFGDAGTRLVVTERVFLDRVIAARDAGTPIETIVVIDRQEGETLPDGVISITQAEGSAEATFDLEASIAAIEPDDVLTLIYTSGTTGPPKGVQLTHANLLGVMRAIETHQPWPRAGAQRIVSFLPSAHVADRWSCHYASLITMGTTVTTCADPKALMQVVSQVRPTVFGGVPRIWEKLKAGIEAMAAAEPDDARREGIQQGIAVAIAKVRAEQRGEPVPDEIAAGAARAEAAIFKPLRDKLGLGEVVWNVVGAAPTPLAVLEFFAAVGLPPCELWGMSETSAVCTTNTPSDYRFGSVGRVLPGVELRIADDGEILVRGPNIMLGYRNQPDKTAEAIDADGWLATGDIGQIDPDGYVSIVDRKKELIINAAGKNMSPANIEARIKSASPLIGQAVCIGDARPYNVALITLDPDGAAGRDPSSPETRELIEEAIEEANSHLSRVEQIKRFKILPGEWQPGGDELTPTSKMKRKPIAAKYADDIEALYG